MTLKKAGVIGFPIHHSKSPIIHNYWLKKYGIRAVYDAFEIKSEELEKFVFSLKEKDFSGINVTVPHKVAVMKLMDELSAAAQKAGAVNTVIVREDGTLFGHNTDGAGFLANILEKKKDFDIKQKPVVILGTGGAARGVCAALVLAGAPEIRLVYRTKEKAENLASSVGGNFRLVEWSKKETILDDAGLLANATTLGMKGFDPLEIDLSGLNASAIVADVVYSPLKTELLKQAEERGHVTADGLGMLLHQACPAFQAWFGVMPEITPELRELVLK
ncbi:MAG: shikimate dehydrogenase [Alphaproteobacteria bacterium]|nr:shikimate dehydrogenase [Alphaproteobacteria bacterium]